VQVDEHVRQVDEDHLRPALRQLGCRLRLGPCRSRLGDLRTAEEPEEPPPPAPAPRSSTRATAPMTRSFFFPPAGFSSVSCSVVSSAMRAPLLRRSLPTF
jgi:hypothetical protein